MILATSYLRGGRHDDLSAIRRAYQNFMDLLRPLLEQATVKLQNRREKRRAEENGHSLNSEVAQTPSRSPAPFKPSLEEAALTLPAPISSGPALAREREGGNKFLDDFEQELRQRIKPRPKARTSPEPPIEGWNKFLDDFEQELRQRIKPPPKARTSPEPPIEDWNKFLDGIEQAVQQILGPNQKDQGRLPAQD
jgi:hypothetical protein